MPSYIGLGLKIVSRLYIKKEQIDQIQVLLISQMRKYREELEIAHYLVQKEINIVRRKRYEDCAISKSGKTINILIRI